MKLTKNRPALPLLLLIGLTFACSLPFQIGEPAGALPSTAVSSTSEMPADAQAGNAETATEKPNPASPAAEEESLSTAGPWFLMKTKDALFAVNEDGTGLVRILPANRWLAPDTLEAAVFSDGQHLVFISASDPRHLRGLTLNLLTLPSGEINTLTRLAAPEVEPPEDAEQGDPAFEAARTLVELNSMAWSPDGKQLAFMGLLEGPTSDLYLYDFPTGTITRLTDGPSQAIRPVWSPDGTLIIHTGVTGLGTGAGFGMTGIWSVEVSGGEISSLYPIPENSGDEGIHGWVSHEELIVSSWSAICGSTHLRRVNSSSGETSSIFAHAFTSMAFDPDHGSFLVYVDRYTAQYDDLSESGLFLFSPGETTPVRIPHEPLKMSWSSEAGQFLLLTDDGILALDPDGVETRFPAEIRTFPVYSPDGSRWAVAQHGADTDGGVWVSDVSGSLLKISSLPFPDLTWTAQEGLLLYGNEGIYYAEPGNLDPQAATSQPIFPEDTLWFRP